MRKKTTEGFIKDAINVHKCYYDYSKVVYNGSFNKIIIICRIHGEFLQRPSDHLCGSGCIKCFAIRNSHSNEQFIELANIKHNNLYNYSLVNYINNHTKVDIICKNHGIFSQRPDPHLRGTGCRKCYNQTVSDRAYTIEEFIRLANIKHNNYYDYSNVIYNTNKNPVNIICPVHGSFMQRPDVHLRGHDCKYCAAGFSKLEISWLDYLQLPEKYRQINIKINNRFFKLDGYNFDTNTVYEFYGDFWHGNPKKYKSDDINIKNNMLFGELYNRTIEREKFLKCCGLNIVSIWESDWKDLIKKG